MQYLVVILIGFVKVQQHFCVFFVENIRHQFEYRSLHLGTFKEFFLLFNKS